MISIFDINGTTEHKEKCKCGSWEDHWIKYNTDKLPWPESCPITGCKETDLKAAHVKIMSTYDNQWYILSLCKEHYEKTNEEFTLNPTASFARADNNMCLRFTPKP